MIRSKIVERVQKVEKKPKRKTLKKPKTDTDQKESSEIKSDNIEMGESINIAVDA